MWEALPCGDLYLPPLPLVEMTSQCAILPKAFPLPLAGDRDSIMRKPSPFPLPQGARGFEVGGQLSAIDPI
jgi:hypothetical protein